MSELVDAFRKSWQKAGDDIKTMKLKVSSLPTQHQYELVSVNDIEYVRADEVSELEIERNAWKEAFLATRAYYSNNNGPNATRYRAAIKQLKEMKLIK